MGSFSFRKSDRLRVSDEIRAVRRAGEKEVFPPLIVYRKKNRQRVPRLAIALTRSAGTSVLRNWTKRKIREFFRLNKDKLGGFDYFFFSSQDLEPLKRGGFEKVTDRLCRWKSG